MRTNEIKSFAKQARLLLLDGVWQRLNYWGFDKNGKCNDDVVEVQGGFMFKGKLDLDITVPAKWQKLKARIKDKQTAQDVVEEAAYTWFNRLMAIKILESNGYIPEQLSYASGLSTPAIVQNAKQGNHSITDKAEKDALLSYLQDDKEELAFGLLVTNFCHTNTLLQNVFGKIDDYTELLLPQNLMQTDGVLDWINSDAINEDEYKEVELIGWLYQFYISDKKDEVFAGFKKNKKARAEDIPAATQIFTPKWIVKYMVENTLGKLYLDYEKDSSLREEMKYLVQNDSDKDATPIISDITELTLIDPASGSGHILVTGFELLYKMYKEAGYNSRQAVEGILQNNLYGLDIDDRAMQLARFAVLLKAAEFDKTILDKGLMPMVYSFPADSIASFFSTQYYNKAHTNFTDLAGLCIAKAVSIAWTETVVNKKTKKEEIKNWSVKFKVGDKLTYRDMELLQEHCEEEIELEYSAELGLFWGDEGIDSKYVTFFNAIKSLRNGKNIGSALKIKLENGALELLTKQYAEWEQAYTGGQLPPEKTRIWQELKAYLDVLFVLAKKYTAVVANPPYMGQKSMNADLKDYVNAHYPVTKSDLMTIFMEVIPNLTLNNARFALINLPSWLFLSSFEKIRTNYIDNFTFDSLIHMGRGIFGIDFGSVAFAIKKTTNKAAIGSYFRLHERNFQHIYYEDIEKLFLYSNNNEGYKYDFTLYRGDEGITEIPIQGSPKGLKLFYPNIPQTNFSKIPGSPIAYWVSEKVVNNFTDNPNLASISEPRIGMATGKNEYYLRGWTEVGLNRIDFESYSRSDAAKSNKKWFRYNKGGELRKWYGNQYYVVNWENDGSELLNTLHPSGKRTWAHNFNLNHIFRDSISWSDITSKGLAFRYYEQGFLFDSSGTSSFFNSKEEMKYVLALMNTKQIERLSKLLNPTIHFTPGDYSRVPYIYSKNKDSEISAIVEICIYLSKSDWNSIETSWNFKYSPLINETQSLELAFLSWQQHVTKDFFQLHANEEELNRIFIDIYGLQDELTSEVALKDITILQDELDRKQLEQLEPVFREQGKDAITLPIDKAEVMSQFVSYCMGVFMGRYRLDKPGLHIAHPNPSAEEIKSYAYNGHTISIDDDAIVPLMGTDCAFPDDALVRTKDLLHAIWGEDTLTENINFLQASLGMDLNKWLTEKFWPYHTKMYKKKPIYWLFSSNTKSPQNAAFKVLVYMHRMDKYTVQKIMRNYLHPHQEFIARQVAKWKANESSLTQDEQIKLATYEDWEIECRAYNGVLKELASHQIEIDLDDGVSENYPKFSPAVADIK